MNVTKEIQRINEKEIDWMITRGLDASGSWHDDYKHSAYIFVGSLPFDLTEGDIITIFSQYGEIEDVNLIRDKETGKSKGFCYLKYLDQRSTNLAVDNLNSIEILDRKIRVDHVKDYKPPKRKGEDGVERLDLSYNAAPKLVEIPTSEEEKEEEKDKESLMIENGIDPDDPMAEYLYEKLMKKEKKAKKSKKSKKEKEEDQSKSR
ncbi:hypothetical protein K502DRAFT_299039 [Neoconidiobolus thromboides FSU 785]|nr:hypothetical protein K502DRAFT_299039 [Neoconidiobolus thromboides FSU 785]